MKFGISAATVGAFAEPKLHQVLARDAEAHGWDGYFLWDAVAHAHRPVLEPWVGLAAMAASTERIRFGPLVSAVVFHRPRQLAATIASLARLGGGRLIVGAGAGDAPEDELTRMNEAALRQRTRQLDETLRTVTEMLGAEDLSVPFWLAASDMSTSLGVGPSPSTSRSSRASRPPIVPRQGTGCARTPQQVSRG